MTVKHLVVIAIAIAVALVGATAVGISAVEHSARRWDPRHARNG